MKSHLWFGFLMAVSACAPNIPDSGAGIGFQDYNSHAGNGSEPYDRTFSAEGAAAAIDRAAGGQAPQDITAAPVLAGGADSALRQPQSHAGISDENDFDAVAKRESIESDASRIAENRAQYVVVEPKAIPSRPGDSGPNIAAFALTTTHDPGVQMYSRSGSRKDPLVVCAKFASSDLAQQEFLAKGGPEKDKLGLDPDGDGFACNWDPRPFRAALK